MHRSQGVLLLVYVSRARKIDVSSLLSASTILLTGRHVIAAAMQRAQLDILNNGSAFQSVSEAAPNGLIQRNKNFAIDNQNSDALWFHAMCG